MKPTPGTAPGTQLSVEVSLGPIEVTNAVSESQTRKAIRKIFYTKVTFIQWCFIKAQHYCDRKLCLLSVFENICTRGQRLGISRHIDKPNIYRENINVFMP